MTTIPFPPAASLYPLFLQLQSRKVLVIGGGAVAERKVRALLASRADVHVGAPRLTTELERQACDKTITWLHGEFQERWLDGAWLVIAATDDEAVNRRARAAAVDRHLWVNVVDNPALSDFHVPAIVDRAPLTVAISSGGFAPVLARRLRERLEALIPYSTGDLARLLEEERVAIRDTFADVTVRRRFYEWILDGPVAASVSRGEIGQARQQLHQGLQGSQPAEIRRLTVLSTPVNDVGHMTLNCLRALHEADTLVHDPNLHVPAVLDMARRDADRLPIAFAAEPDAPATVAAILAAVPAGVRAVLLVSEHTSQIHALAQQLELSGIKVEIR